MPFSETGPPAAGKRGPIGPGCFNNHTDIFRPAECFQVGFYLFPDDFPFIPFGDRIKNKGIFINPMQKPRRCARNYSLKFGNMGKYYNRNTDS